MKKDVDLIRYQEFVESITSNESNDFEFFVNRLKVLNSEKIANIPLLLTSGIGLSTESGEFLEIIKKNVFQGKPLNEEIKSRLEGELGDVFFYLINACRALNLDPNEVIKTNINKLVNRFPAGKFDVYYSENRKEGDK